MFTLRPVYFCLGFAVEYPFYRRHGQHSVFLCRPHIVRLLCSCSSNEHQALYPRRSYIMWSQRLWPEFLDMECSRCFSFNGRDWYIVILFCVPGYRGTGEVFIKQIAANLLIEFSGLSGFILTTVVSSPREYCIPSCATVRPLVYQPMASVTRYSHCTFSIVRKTAAFLQTELDYYFKSIAGSLRSSHLPAIARQRQ